MEPNHRDSKRFFRAYLIIACTTSIVALLLCSALDKESIKWFPLIVIFVFVLFAPLTTLSLLLSTVFVHNNRWINRIWLNIIASCLMIAIYCGSIFLREYLDGRELFPKFLCHFNGRKWILSDLWGVFLQALFSVCLFMLIISVIEYFRKRLYHHHQS